MVQFHNALSNFANLASWETIVGYQSPPWNLFSQNQSHNDAKKNRLQDFYDIFYLHV